MLCSAALLTHKKERKMKELLREVSQIESDTDFIKILRPYLNALSILLIEAISNTLAKVLFMAWHKKLMYKKGAWIMQGFEP